VATALLRRDGLIIAAIFANGELRYTEAAPVTGDIYQYTVEVADHAGNTVSSGRSYTVIGDSPPTVTLISPDNPIRERSAFKVRVSAFDDLGLERVEATWNDQIATAAFSGQGTSEAHTFALEDERSERITQPVSEPLVVRFYDNSGQTAEGSVSVTVQPDRAPDATQLAISKPAAAFFDTTVPVTIADLNLADDGGYAGLTLAIVDITGGGAREIYRSRGQAAIQTAMRMPATDAHGGQMRFFVRLMDELGQMDDSAELTIDLSQMPNQIVYFDSGDAALNREFAAVGEPAPLQVQVLDSAGRPVAGQTVQWSIASGPQDAGADLGTADTDDQGLALFSFDTTRAAGTYRIRATVISFAAVQTAHDLQILPGALDHIEIAYTPPVEAGAILTVVLRGVDAVGNTVPTAAEPVYLRIEDPGFHFGFAANMVVTPLTVAQEIIGERAEVTLVNGSAEVQIAASGTSGDYAAGVSFPDGSVLFARYDDDNDSATAPIETDQVPIAVLNGPPDQLRLEQVALSNHELGHPEILEVGETASVRLTLADSYGNTVYTVVDINGGRKDADFDVTVTFSGDATSDGTADEVDLAMVRGTVEFPVSDETIEAVEVAVAAIVPLPPQLDTAAGLTLDFGKHVPAIVSTAFETAHDHLNPAIVFSYNEPVENGGSADPVAVQLDGQAVAGTTVAADSQIVFTAAAPVELNRCYTFDTTASSWIGQAAQDAVLTQQGTVCSPQVGIPAQISDVAVEDTLRTLEILTGAGIDPSGFSDGRIVINGVGTDFNWADTTFRVPSFSGSGVDDATVMTLALSGRYDGEALRVANTISVRLLLKAGDYDEDGLPNGLEARLGLNPTAMDSDGNGTLDGDEDSDNDGLSNAGG
jgi:hypothetical protein